MASEFLEVMVDEEVVQQREEYESIRGILIELIEKGNISTVDMFVLCHWLIEKNNFTEDAAVMLDKWLQENDISISDEFAYYRSIMEGQPTA